MIHQVHTMVWFLLALQALPPQYGKLDQDVEVGRCVYPRNSKVLLRVALPPFPPLNDMQRLGRGPFPPLHVAMVRSWVHMDREQPARLALLPQTVI